MRWLGKCEKKKTEKKIKWYRSVQTLFEGLNIINIINAKEKFKFCMAFIENGQKM